MGKTIIQQARGHGSKSYRVRRKAYNVRIGYPNVKEGEATVIKLMTSAGHTAPLAKIIINNKVSYIPAAEGTYEGQKIMFNVTSDKIPESGNILQLRNIPVGSQIFNIESRPLDGGKLIRSGGSSAILVSIDKNKATIAFPSKKRKVLNADCRASVGRIAGHGRKEKPWVKAGRKHFLMKARNKLWPRTSALKFNAIDHPFGSGRGKHPKSKIAKRNAPPGAKVGHIRPSRTGRRKK